MYEGNPEEIEKGNDELGEYRLLRAKEKEIDVDNGNDNNPFEFNEENWIEEEQKIK